jgi:hypothetical protein
VRWAGDRVSNARVLGWVDRELGKRVSMWLSCVEASRLATYQAAVEEKKSRVVLAEHDGQTRQLLS